MRSAKSLPRIPPTQEVTTSLAEAIASRALWPLASESKGTTTTYGANHTIPGTAFLGRDKSRYDAFAKPVCIRQGLLSRALLVNWGHQVTIPAEAVKKVNLLRSRIHILLWAGSNLPYPSLPIFLGIELWRRRARRSLKAKGRS